MPEPSGSEYCRGDVAALLSDHGGVRVPNTKYPQIPKKKQITATATPLIPGHAVFNNGTTLVQAQWMKR